MSNDHVKGNKFTKTKIKTRNLYKDRNQDFFIFYLRNNEPKNGTDVGVNKCGNFKIKQVVFMPKLSTVIFAWQMLAVYEKKKGNGGHVFTV